MFRCIYDQWNRISPNPLFLTNFSFSLCIAAYWKFQDVIANIPFESDCLTENSPRLLLLTIRVIPNLSNVLLSIISNRWLLSDLLIRSFQLILHCCIPIGVFQSVIEHLLPGYYYPYFCVPIHAEQSKLIISNPLFIFQSFDLKIRMLFLTPVFRHVWSIVPNHYF